MYYKGFEILATKDGFEVHEGIVITILDSIEEAKAYIDEITQNQ